MDLICLLQKFISQLKQTVGDPVNMEAFRGIQTHNQLWRLYYFTQVNLKLNIKIYIVDQISKSDRFL